MNVGALPLTVPLRLLFVKSEVIAPRVRQRELEKEASRSNLAVVVEKVATGTVTVLDLD